MPSPKEVPIDPSLLDYYNGFTYMALVDDGRPVDELLEEVRNAVEALPTLEREAIELVFWGQKSKRAAAREMRVSVSTLHRLIKSAKPKLRKVLTIVEDGDKLPGK